MRAAVIGAGPSGFFVAGELLKRCPGCEVHLYDKRIAPYGLVRYGVAPDHLLTRRAIKMFDQIADHGRFHYFGNVEIGRDVALSDIISTYHAVVVCTGAEKPNRPEVPGARLRGAVDALDLARWANGEPDAFDPALLDGVDTAVIIGHGNVALDAARLLMRPARDWVATDIAPHAMEVLIHHRLKRIVLAGRRGSSETSFTEAEWEEAIALPGWQVHIEGEPPFGPRPEKPAAERSLDVRFHLRPVCLLGGDRVVGVRFSHAQNGATVEVPASLVIFATGHRGVPLDGLPFDATTGTVPHSKGAVSSLPGVYVCGWIKRGAKGLIGVNRKDAIETVVRLLEDRDILSARLPESKNWRETLTRRGVRVVSWTDWKKLDAMEEQRGASVGRPRVNFTRDEALARLAEADAAAGA